MTDLPEPLTPPDCDCTDLDGFMLNVERLMASELVALSTHEEIAAALFLWCRAWKQMPAASLPDDERVMAAFARLPLSRFRKMRATVMRGFVLCSDGRWYHRHLSAEAVNAYSRKLTFQKRREADAERLRKWRASQSETLGETAHETGGETQSETRFVAEGQGQGQGQRRSIPFSEVENGRTAALPLPEPTPKPDKAAKPDPWKQVYDRGKEVLGSEAGGQITKLKKLYDNKPAKVIAKIEDAAEQREPARWLAAFLWNVNDGGKLAGEYIGGVPPP